MGVSADFSKELKYKSSVIVIFTRQETVIESALQRSMMLLAPKVELRIVSWYGTSDLKTLQECMKKSRPPILVVNTYDCSARQVIQLFQAGIKPAPNSLVVFGPQAAEIAQDSGVLEWVNGNATGQRVLNLTYLLMLSEKLHGGSYMTFLSGCHDLKSSLKRILDESGRPLSERCNSMLGLLENFARVHIDFEAGDDISQFFGAFRDLLLTVVSEGVENLPGKNHVLEPVMRYINALSSVPDMRKLVNKDAPVRQGDRRPGINEKDETKPDNRILVSVLIVEDNHDFAASLIERYRIYLPKVEKFNIEFALHLPQKDSEGKVTETRREFRERLIKRIRCESTLWQDESLTRLQAVIMDYAMDNFAPENNGEKAMNLSGVDLSYEIRALRPGVEIFLLTGKSILQVVGEGDGIFERTAWKHDPTGGEIAELFYAMIRGLDRKYEAPFWDALRKFTGRPVIVMHAMSLARGKSAKKSTVLKDFVEFYSDNYFMAETSATIEPLDSLLHPVGSIQKAQNKCAHAFGAKSTYFVTNGTSTANKIVLQGILAPGDAVLVDRNCHISHHYGISLARARPYYLEPYHLEAYGISGGIPLQVLAETLKGFLTVENEGIADNAKMRLPKAILLTNCTFDGIVCKPRQVIETVRRVLREVGVNQERLREIVFLFDEAWFAYARFHPRFIEHTGMATARALCEEERASGEADNFYTKNLRVYVTQSTHKTLSAFRQASMIHIWDPVLEADHVTALKFNEAFLTHTSTSPHSGIIASLDVARRQAELEGCALVDEALKISNVFRDDFTWAQMGRSSVNSSRVGRYFDVLTATDLIPDEYREQFDLDPSKITLHIKKGYSGSEMKKLLLTEHDIQFNKHSANTVLLMVNAGGSMSSMGTLKTVLTRMAIEIERKFVIREMVEGPAALKIPAFSHFWDVDINGYNPGLRRDIAFFFNNEAKWPIEWLPIGESLVGRTSATFVVPYPPGYPMLVPGQYIDAFTTDFLASIDTKEIHGARPGEDGKREVPVFISN
jgi:arginine decarboxylase